MTSQLKKSPAEQRDVPVSRGMDRTALVLLVLAIAAYVVAAVSVFSEAIPEAVTWGALGTEAVLIVLGILVAMLRFWQKAHRNKV
ncbi:MAG: hypothetical protein HY680_05410 [Chloroflexi bacterium]|nr:hypothetical protein [Chloroflexota bacterium]